MFRPGDPAPWFHAPSTVNPVYHFDTAAGRYIVLSFLGSSAHPGSRPFLDVIERQRKLFNVTDFCFFGVSTDPEDEHLGRLKFEWPGFIYFWDNDLAVSRLFRVASEDGSQYERQTIVLDPMLRVLTVFPFDDDGEQHARQVLEYLRTLPLVETLTGFAPVLLVPRVFEREFCRELIALYEKDGGYESGFMRERDGRTVGVYDHAQKRRRDHDITDQTVIKAAQARMYRRLTPEIKKAFQFNPTRIERHIVACYDGSEGGHFRAHRDNTTKGTAHRRFAVTINLNEEEFEGGELRFPEFGPRTYRAPTGGAVVFSCSLLHTALPVTRGKRYAFLPFLYDEEAATVRQMNRQFLDNPRPSPSA
jgi:predicted 2-oxoglutarate/Fe(II)-dependent dioxygenase YbiX/peroxiredoxin